MNALIQAAIDGTADRILAGFALLPVAVAFVVAGMLVARWAIGGPR